MKQNQLKKNKKGMKEKVLSDAPIVLMGIDLNTLPPLGELL